MKLHEENEPFFITEDIAAEMAAAGYKFKPPAMPERRASATCTGGNPGRLWKRPLPGTSAGSVHPLDLRMAFFMASIGIPFVRY
ncbi:MAG: hypothetical protein DDT26_02117 [Dehalococcoidia bacterium]|nr:hypothetical protein [Chloroflexota bacterium]